MAKDFAIVCDSSADLEAFWCAENDVGLVPLKVHTPQGVFSDVVELSPWHALELLDRDVPVSVSQPSVAEFRSVFQRLSAEGRRECACVCTSRVTSVNQKNARLAAEAAMRELPIRIEVIDSLTVSAGEGIVVCDLVRNRVKGLSFGDAVSHVRKLAAHLSTLVVLPPGHSALLSSRPTLLDRTLANAASVFGLWSLVAHDALGAPKVVARSRDPRQLAELASSLTALDREREGRLAHATFTTNDSELSRTLEETLTLMLDTNHDLGSVQTSASVMLRVGLGAVGIAYVPIDLCVSDPGLPLFRSMSRPRHAQ